MKDVAGNHSDFARELMTVYAEAAKRWSRGELEAPVKLLERQVCMAWICLRTG